jgi:GH24 family phage-related lysozyme (muramidase)
LPTYEKIVNNNAKVQLTQEQFDALVSLALNAGESAVMDLLILINAGNCDPADIANAFAKGNNITDNNIGKKVPNEGLTDRRAQEAAIFNFARYP